jgi:hypothetical protein
VLFGIHLYFPCSGVGLDWALSMLSTDHLSSHARRLDIEKLLGRFVEESDLIGFLRIYLGKILV